MKTWLNKHPIVTTAILLICANVIFGFTIWGGTQFIALTGGTLTGPLISTVASNGAFQAPNSAGTCTSGLTPYTFSSGLTTGWGFDGTTFYSCTNGAQGVAQNTTTFNIPGILSSTRAAATGFTRIGPNMQIQTGAPPATTAITTACTAIALTSTYNVPATSKAITAHVILRLATGTAIGLQNVQVHFYSDAGCTTILGGTQVVTTLEVENLDNYLTAGYSNPQVTGTAFLYSNGAANIYAKKFETLTTGGATSVTFNEVPIIYD